MYLVFDIGGTYIKYSLMKKDGTISFKDKTPTPRGYEHTIEEFLDIMTEIYQTIKEDNVIEGIALSLPGQIDIEKGIVYGGGALPYLDKVSLGSILSERCDNIHVALENDAKCAALAEAWLGKAKDCETAVVLVFGTGIGCGIVMNGKIHHGQDLVAGEVSFFLDHLYMEELPNIKPINELKKREDFLDFPTGMWSNKASIMYLRKAVSRYKGLAYEDVSGEQIYKWADEGDKFINVLLENAYLTIAKHICNFYVMLAPQIILIGGGISSNEEFMDGINRYVEKIRQFSWIYRSMRVDSCQFLNDSNMIGALRNYQLLYEHDDN